MSRFTWRLKCIETYYDEGAWCWSCMCGVMFCRYTRRSRNHHVRAEYQLPLRSENGTKTPLLFRIHHFQLIRQLLLCI